METSTILEPFGTWLLKQAGREDAIGELAQGARRDPRFPVSGDAEAVRKRLRAMQAEGDLFAAVDDAEVEWMPSGEANADCDVIIPASMAGLIDQEPIRSWLLDNCAGGVAGHRMSGFYTLRFERSADAAAFKSECL